MQTSGHQGVCFIVTSPQPDFHSRRDIVDSRDVTLDVTRH